MARKQITQYIDDLDGAVLDEGEGTTIRFSLQGRSYDIDLSAPNAQKLRDALAPFIEVATPVPAVAKSDRSRTKRGVDQKADLAAIRAWANDNGYTVSDRGRVPATVLEAYNAAH
ncbi:MULTISPECIES: histone-like nucleoid-structuring protein Lsr2 [unclassified Microbacterium]|uniref:histone-like nucleoid-structuring protein Lsr2 n=1 Tax=unclassified Microbacterium TaxID=2609290 RepID=UPI000445FE6F|nr:Lsr2 family protein [Microbacterium sp. MRS-1]EXJ51466.1 hypothetical protein AS96_09145 [Microbacterium sp. MRS-1]